MKYHLDHALCSRVHAAFVYHKHLNIAYLVDLGSSINQGQFLSDIRDPHKCGNRAHYLERSAQLHYEYIVNLAAFRIPTISYAVDINDAPQHG
uniref:FHA domain-containing protein n=1 Tax=Glossina pallidipes TaxID=7398 RepID=A0A1A9ZRB5_GLOPL